MNTTIATRALRTRPYGRVAFRQVRGLHQTRPLLRAAPKEEHRAHTISQRLRQIRKIPPELIPLGIVLGIAIGAAAYSSINKLFSDKTLRLTRSKRDH